MAKKTHIPYNRLSDGAKSKLSTTAIRLERSGIRRYDIFDKKGNQIMSDTQIKSVLGFKGKKTSFDGLKRNIKQISFDLDRKQGVLKDTLPKFIKLGYKRKGLNLVKVRMNKIIGLNTFHDIVREVQTRFGLTKEQSYDKTRDMLTQAKINFNKLPSAERQVLSFFS